jgi:tricorn protease
MSLQGYYRTPAIYDNQIVFVSEDDLWVVSAEGGLAHRLTTGLGMVTTPVFSPDGSMIAFGGSDE